MELLTSFVDIVLHLDRHLQWLVANYGPWIYAILFAIVFCETGLVVTPFLPGDSLLFVSLGIMAYLAVRFEWKFGLATIIANLHDVVIIVGFFSLFQWEFSLPVLAAVLAILGYSVNESVVVFDRVRETFRNRRMRGLSVPQVLDHAITATMSRTIITHGCTQLMVCSMLIFGGETLFYFALALTIGILFGIYSSVLVASPIVMYLGVSREDLARPEVQKKPGEYGAVV